MHLVAALVLGVAIGLSLGALGGGGSILTVPALVYVVGESAHAATTESLVIVGVTSLIATAGHARDGSVRWLHGVAFGAIGIAASYAGTAANTTLDPNVLLLCFAVLILVAGTAMTLRLRTEAADRTVSAHHVPDRVLAAVGARAEPGPPARTCVPAPRHDSAKTAAKVFGAGLVVGFLTGFFGVGGGFVIVPALVIALGFEMPVAVGTSLLVIAINSASALLARTGHVSFHWAVIAPFTLAAVVGSLAGRKVAVAVPAATLGRMFVALLFSVAIYVMFRSVVALS